MIVLRASHREIHKLINEKKAKIKDKDFFESKVFRGYLEDIAEVVSKRYKRPIEVNVTYDKEQNYVAKTDNRVIYINADNEFTSYWNNRVDKTKSIIGFLAHELGHVNFTDFCLLSVFYSKLQKGTFYPAEPCPENPEEELALCEIKDLLVAKDKIAVNVISGVLGDLSNALEDAYIEAKMCQEFPGRLKSCIIMQRAIFSETIPSINYQIANHNSELAIVLNLILSYATVGKINNEDNYNGELLDTFNNCIMQIDNAIYDDNIKMRFTSSLQILLKIWKYVKAMIEKTKEKQGDSEKFTDKEITEMCNKELTSMRPQSGSVPKGNSTKVGKAATENPTEPMSAIKEEIKKVVEEELGRMKLMDTDSIKTPNGSGNIQKKIFGGSNYDCCASDIERILSQVAKEKVFLAEEKQLKKDLQAEAGKINYGEIHKGVDVDIYRINPVPERLISAYNNVSPKLLSLSKKLQVGIHNVIKDRKYGYKLSGLYMGKRTEARSFIRKDGKYFYKSNLPNDEMDLAVSVLVDESGSMCSRDRITTARATAIIMYDFCKSLNIPISIIGHTADYRGMDLFSYADFDSVDGNDKYRIMDMSSRSGNRDGAALRFVAEHLLKREEKVKLLIIISDGQPAANDYFGTAAEEDLRQIKREYTKKGITLFAAAIGDDKEAMSA